MTKVKSDLSGITKLQENMEAFGANDQAPLTEILNSNFVSSHSRFADFESLLAEIGVTNAEQFQALPTEDFDAFISANTDFESWLDMQKQGVASYAKAAILKGFKK